MKSWDPFRDLLTIQDRMNKLFESVLTGPVAPDMAGEEIGYWRPTAEVVDTRDSLEICCELPGLDRDAVDVSVEGGILTIQGERARPDRSESWAFHRLERPYGRFLRRFELPDGLDGDAVAATMSGGVLTVSLPKHATA